MSKGIVIFAENNERLNYVRIACASALMAKHAMNVDVVLITDKDDYFINYNQVNRIFSDVIIIDKVKSSDRMFKGTERVKLSYYNQNRVRAFELTPFDETLVMDADFFMMNDIFNLVWGNAEDFLINKKVKGVLMHDLHFSDRRISDRSLLMRWATLFYFRKTQKTETLFYLIKHISNNYDYFSKLYGFNSNTFRNDFVFSIACHMLNDFSDSGIGSLPRDYLVTAVPDDKIFDIKKDKIGFHIKCADGMYPLYLKNENVHIMNKFSLSEHLDEVFEHYGGF